MTDKLKELRRLVEVKVRPCPFCGDTPDIDNHLTFEADQGTKWGHIVCCGQGPEVRTGYQDVEHWRDDAITEWNKRADDAVMLALIEVAEAARDYASENDRRPLDDRLMALRAALAELKKLEETDGST